VFHGHKLPPLPNRTGSPGTIAVVAVASDFVRVKHKLVSGRATGAPWIG